MSDLVRIGGAAGLSRLDQRISSRTLSRMQASTEIDLARIEQRAMMQVAKTDAVA
jgi:hypothetical protein